jgi:hypothetical protein
VELLLQTVPIQFLQVLLHQLQVVAVHHEMGVALQEQVAQAAAVQVL